MSAFYFSSRPMECGWIDSKHDVGRWDVSEVFLFYVFLIFISVPRQLYIGQANLLPRDVCPGRNCLNTQPLQVMCRHFSLVVPMVFVGGGSIPSMASRSSRKVGRYFRLCEHPRQLDSLTIKNCYGQYVSAARAGCV